MARDRRGTGRRGTGRRWLAGARRICVLTAVVASAAGCVGMPNSGSPGTFGATPQATTQNLNFIGALPAGPQPGWSPQQIVEGFLNASASYPTYATIAREYLTGQAIKTWDPGWSVQVVDQVDVPGQGGIKVGPRQATVDASGSVKASFNGSGQFVAAQQSRVTRDASKVFHLVKVDGEWRIVNPLPIGRMLNESDFASVYKPQDLYFFDPNGEVLVPDSVFVPVGTSPTSLVSNLVGALLKDPQTAWLQSGTTSPPPTITAFPSVSKIGTNVFVTADGTTVTVNLTGAAAASASTLVLPEIAAQLVWTLTGPQQNSPAIQAVQLELNGHPWITPNAGPCGGGSSQGPAQKLAMYDCFNPYPVGVPANFYYVNGGQAWSRCAPENRVTQGLIGSVLSVFTQAGEAQLGQPCGPSVHAQSTVTPPSQPRGQPALSMVAVSADGDYVAGVAGSTTQVWKSGSTKPSNSMPTSGVTAISWDRTDYLWVAENETTWMVAPASNGASHPPITNTFGGKIVGLSVAPDGVRVAAIAQAATGPELELAAIDRSLPSPGRVVNPWNRTSIGPPVKLGPNLSDPIALTWYNADDLLVLDRTGGASTLWEVPVDGQPAIQYPGVPANAISITADSTLNALAVGLSSDAMAVSASLEGPWQTLKNNGRNPAFPVPVPLSAQS